jgi:hypothetical protein
VWAGILLGLLLLPVAHAGEGMWPLSNLPVATLKQRFGFTPMYRTRLLRHNFGLCCQRQL